MDFLLDSFPVHQEQRKNKLTWMQVCFSGHGSKSGASAVATRAAQDRKRAHRHKGTSSARNPKKVQSRFYAIFIFRLLLANNFPSVFW